VEETTTPFRDAAESDCAAAAVANIRQAITAIAFVRII
jgi:hypothetical protein